MITFESQQATNLMEQWPKASSNFPLTTESTLETLRDPSRPIVMNNTEDEPLMLEGYPTQTPREVDFAIRRTFSEGLRNFQLTYIKTGENLPGYILMTRSSSLRLYKILSSNILKRMIEGSWPHVGRKLEVMCACLLTLKLPKVSQSGSLQQAYLSCPKCRKNHRKAKFQQAATIERSYFPPSQHDACKDQDGHIEEFRG